MRKRVLIVLLVVLIVWLFKNSNPALEEHVTEEPPIDKGGGLHETVKDVADYFGGLESSKDDDLFEKVMGRGDYK